MLGNTSIVSTDDDGRVDDKQPDEVVKTQDGNVRMVTIRLPDTNQVAWVKIEAGPD